VRGAVIAGVVALVLVVGGLRAERRGWVRPRGRPRGQAALGMLALDGIFSPERHRAREELAQQRHARAPVPSPADPPLPEDGPGFRGRVTLAGPRADPGKHE
jgi:hypothetical protein